MSDEKISYTAIFLNFWYPSHISGMTDSNISYTGKFPVLHFPVLLLPVAHFPVLLFPARTSALIFRTVMLNETNLPSTPQPNSRDGDETATRLMRPERRPTSGIEIALDRPSGRLSKVDTAILASRRSVSRPKLRPRLWTNETETEIKILDSRSVWSPDCNISDELIIRVT